MLVCQLGPDIFVGISSNVLHEVTHVEIAVVTPNGDIICKSTDIISGMNRLSKDATSWLVLSEEPVTRWLERHLDRSGSPVRFRPPGSPGTEVETVQPPGSPFAPSEVKLYEASHSEN